jgi:hypothetical protein
MTRLALALAALLPLCGCPWNDPCWLQECGSSCTWCDEDDAACQQTESSHVCDRGGACVPLGSGAGTGPLCGAAP